MKILKFVESPARSKSSRPERGRDATIRSKRTGIVMHDFVSALRQMEYGNLSVHYSEQILKGIEGDLELSGFNIQDLRGIEFCENLTGLDLSNNYIDDLQPLSSLFHIEVLNLSLNDIGRIEALSELHQLRLLDLSLNRISDIRPLLGLPRLKSVNLIGNPIPGDLIDELRDIVDDLLF